MSRNYIVKLKDKNSPRRGKPKQEFEELDSYLTELTDQQALAMWNAPEVEFFELDQPAYAAITQSPCPSWGLDRIDQPAMPLDQSYTYNRTGYGVEIHILDSGIRYSHSEFGGRAVFGTDAFGGNGSDDFGHGTHVAGIAAGEHYGVAKRAKIFSHKVLDATGNGQTSNIISALNWLTARKRKGKYARVPMAANISIILSGVSASLDNAVNTCADAGVVVCVAAGNWGYDAGNYSPARAEKALCSGATNSYDQRPGYSNVGEAVDIYAPGQVIPSAGKDADDQIVYKSGTSMSSPFSCGVAAQWLEIKPSMSSAEVRQKIIETAAIIEMGTAYGPVIAKLLQSAN